MSFSESLTVRILGDSSGLHSELEQVEQAIDQLHDRIQSTTQAGQQIGSALSRVSTATGPLQQVSSLLSRIGQQARVLSQQPITLNVQPALAALSQLLQAIATVAAQLRSVSSGTPIRGGGGQPGNRVPPAAPATVDRTGRPLASGGLVAGPPGIDRIPARLTAGEFVLNRAAVDTVGHAFVDRLNQRPESILHDPRPQRAFPGPTAESSTARPVIDTHARSAMTAVPATVYSSQARTETNHHTVNHFGGITVQVSQATELQSVIDSLESQQLALRNRRG